LFHAIILPPNAKRYIFSECRSVTHPHRWFRRSTVPYRTECDLSSAIMREFIQTERHHVEDVVLCKKVYSERLNASIPSTNLFIWLMRENVELFAMTTRLFISEIVHTANSSDVTFLKFYIVSVMTIPTTNLAMLQSNKAMICTPRYDSFRLLQWCCILLVHFVDIFFPNPQSGVKECARSLIAYCERQNWRFKFPSQLQVRILQFSIWNMKRSKFAIGSCESRRCDDKTFNERTQSGWYWRVTVTNSVPPVRAAAERNTDG
jgi:hypothetical protein